MSMLRLMTQYTCSPNSVAAMDEPLLTTGIRSPLSRPVSVDPMLQVRQIEDRDAEELRRTHSRWRRGPVVERDGVGDDAPVGMRKAAVGHGAVHEPVAAFAGLKSTRRRTAADWQWSRPRCGRPRARPASRSRRRSARCACSSRMSPCVALISTSLGPPESCRWPSASSFGGGAVIGDLVGAKHVIAVVKDHVARERDNVAGPRLALCFPLHGRAGGGGWLGLGDGKHFLAGIVGELRGGGICGSAGLGG